MTLRTDGPRHRAARRSITPLAALSTGATGNAAALGRRTAIVAASSGLLVSLMGAAPASAAPASADAALSTFDVDTLTAQASAALVTAPAVTVAADASWTVEQTSITVTPAPEPEPEPEPEPVRASTTTTSRSAERTAVTETAAPAAAAIPASANGSAIIDAASRYVGVPYVYGGTTPSGFDCSGFTSYVFAQVGISLPRTSGAQQAAGTVVSRADAQPGDLIFSPGHIGIYAGGNTQIDAPRPGKTIQFRDIWQSNPTFIRVG
ncbi:NlpC/P60 family protein [Sanguibacter sp. 25GB23B1]|uniref:C40 family peptidase n=1 Tax=unclassified Sanguibacter TaxID=2645534 RepID=UPI0032AF3205